MNPLLYAMQQGIWPTLVVIGLLTCMLAWIDTKHRLRWLPVFVVFLVTVRYIVWRITDTLPPSDEVTNFSIGVIFLIIELLAAAGSLLTLLTISRYRDRSSTVDARLSHRETGYQEPLIDVFICTYNEEEQILERTIAGALAMEYGNFRVWVLDDGRRKWLEDLADSMGCRYLTRPDNAYAKAGNINHALQYVANLEQSPEFVSILDADFVPTRIFLQRAVTLFDEADVGIVQTPQHFVNPDPIQVNLGAADVWPDEQRFFFDILMPSKDAWGTAFCCGTSSVIRFNALQESHGFPTSSITEDYLLTLRLKQHGYRTVYLNERLSLGLAPEGLGEYITQRSRWCLGFIQILRSKDGPFFPNRLTLMDRISLVESFLYWSGTYLFRLAGLLIPIMYFLFDIRALDVELGSGLAHFLPYFVGQVIVIGWLSGGRILPILTDVTQLLAMREILFSVCIGLVKPKGHKFKVTAKGGDRTKVIIQWHMITFFGIFLVATLLGLLMSFHLDEHRSLEDSSIIGLFWCWYNILLLLIAITCCIEKPRKRRAERLKATGSVKIQINGKWSPAELMDISVFGMRLGGGFSVAPGSRVTINYFGQELLGAVARAGENDVAIELEHSLGSRLYMIREVHSGRFNSFFNGVKTSTLGRRVISQLLG